MSAEPVGDQAFEDLTARARIRDAALQLFTERGIGGATIRDIAKAAGVSSGLVRHHFGSKEALREACDAYAVDRLVHFQEEVFEEGRMADAGFMVSSQPTVMRLQSYLIRSMVDGSETAAAMFGQMVQMGEQWIADQGFESRDPRAFATVLVAMKMGVFLLRDQVSRSLGVDIGTPAGHARVNRGFIEAFAAPLISPEQAAQLHAAIDQMQAQAGRGGAVG
jgi:AcrR family transcriptional regulator